MATYVRDPMTSGFLGPFMNRPVFHVTAGWFVGDRSLNISDAIIFYAYSTEIFRIRAAILQGPIII